MHIFDPTALTKWCCISFPETDSLLIQGFQNSKYGYGTSLVLANNLLLTSNSIFDPILSQIDDKNKLSKAGALAAAEKAIGEAADKETKLKIAEEIVDVCEKEGEMNVNLDAFSGETDRQLRST